MIEVTFAGSKSVISNVLPAKRSMLPTARSDTFVSLTFVRLKITSCGVPAMVMGSRPVNVTVRVAGPPEKVIEPSVTFAYVVLTVL